jgi:hypothetical protein
LPLPSRRLPKVRHREGESAEPGDRVGVPLGGVAAPACRTPDTSSLSHRGPAVAAGAWRASIGAGCGCGGRGVFWWWWCCCCCCCCCSSSSSRGSCSWSSSWSSSSCATGDDATSPISPSPSSVIRQAVRPTSSSSAVSSPPMQRALLQHALYAMHRGGFCVRKQSRGWVGRPVYRRVVCRRPNRRRRISCLAVVLVLGLFILPTNSRGVCAKRLPERPSFPAPVPSVLRCRCCRPCKSKLAFLRHAGNRRSSPLGSPLPLKSSSRAPSVWGVPPVCEVASRGGGRRRVRK